jgi:hypothetical protein
MPIGAKIMLKNGNVILTTAQNVEMAPQYIIVGIAFLQAASHPPRAVQS